MRERDSIRSYWSEGGISCLNLVVDRGEMRGMAFWYLDLDCGSGRLENLGLCVRTNDKY